jgi:hypothetical protein
MMAHASGIGRLAGLAVGLGIGAALTANAGTASADEFDFQISIDGYDLIPAADTSATATSSTGDFAIAIGDGANATATEGSFDGAFADGTDSTAVSGDGNFDFASATGAGSGAGVGNGSGDVAISNGANTAAFAGGDSVTDEGVTTNYPGSDDFAYALGPQTAGPQVEAIAGGYFGVETPSSNDVALVVDPFDTAGSSAASGTGDNDFAAAFGDALHAMAVAGNDLFTILPSL